MEDLDNDQEIIDKEIANKEVLDEDDFQGGLEEQMDHDNRMGAIGQKIENEALNPEPKTHSVYGSI